MKMTDTSTDKRDDRTLALAAFILFLVGFFLPFLCWTFRLPDALLFAACGAELLALAFGVMSWRWRLGKIATIGAALFCLLGITNLILFYSAR